MSKTSVTVIEPPTLGGLKTIESDPIAAAIAEERALLTDKAVVGDTDPSNSYKVKQPPRCEACGGVAHGPVMEWVNCLRRHLQTARAALPEAELPCKGCGKSHAALDQWAACMEASLEWARKRARVGVTPEQFAANRAESNRRSLGRGVVEKD